MKKYIGGCAVQGIRWLAALAWTTLVVVLLLIPSEKRIAHEHSLSSFFRSLFSLSLERSDLPELVTHIFLFGILTGLWYWTFIVYRSKRKALHLSIVIAVLLGIATEAGQYFVARGTSLIDLLANFLGIALLSAWLYRRS